MNRSELIAMLNRDLADEHAAVIRYLVHSYQEGEDTPLGASLLSRSREEMWHMHWLGMIIGELGGEPNLEPAPYPYDPQNRATILQSYIAYEENLIPHYTGEAASVDDAHIKRVLAREAWESGIHARRFQRLLDKLSREDAFSLPAGEHALPADFREKLQGEIAAKYTEMLQHIRYAWVYQKEDTAGWRLMDQAMEKMKHLAAFAEAVTEDGETPRLAANDVGMETTLDDALAKAVADLVADQRRHRALSDEAETKRHGGLVIKLDLTVQQEAYQEKEITGWRK